MKNDPGNASVHRREQHCQEVVRASIRRIDPQRPYVTSMIVIETLYIVRVY